MEECLHRHAYRLRGRNMELAVWDASRRLFVGLREKGHWRLETEFHCRDEAAGCFRTALPVERLERCPVENLRFKQDGAMNKSLWDYLVDLHERNNITVRRAYGSDSAEALHALEAVRPELP